jgi:hypothetical protein
MWQAPSQNKKFGKKRSINSSGRPMHLKRVVAEVKLVDPQAGVGEASAPLKVRIVLNDLSPKGISLFCTQKLMHGQEVAVTLTEPSMIYLRGKVLACQEHDPNSHVLTEHPFAYRIAVLFNFESEAEKAAVAKYVSEVVDMLLPQPAAPIAA